MVSMKEMAFVSNRIRGESGDVNVPKTYGWKIKLHRMMQKK